MKRPPVDKHAFANLVKKQAKKVCKEQDEKIDGFFGIAEEAESMSAAMLRHCALTAYKYREDPDALRVFSFVWGRSADAMVRAVKRHPEWFFQGREEAETATVDDLRNLLILGQTTGSMDAVLYEFWIENRTIRPFQLQQIVLNAKKQRVPEKKRVKLKGKVTGKSRIGANGTVQFFVEEGSVLEDVTDGAEYSVEMTPGGADVNRGGLCETES